MSTPTERAKERRRAERTASLGADLRIITVNYLESQGVPREQAMLLVSPDYSLIDTLMDTIEDYAEELVTEVEADATTLLGQAGQRQRLAGASRPEVTQ